ncbi:MAG TPA: gluconate 2-dehydrogenase subunit 3 family protein [Streptosporangiaceae bacterium]|jgi:Gluconate 2-dehydrogenase subunit 3
MPAFLTALQYSILEAVCARLVPADGAPDGAEIGAVDYIDTLLGAFTFTPPRIWAGGPFSGRFGGAASFSDFEELSPAEELAWRTRIEGSLGIPERERLGPVAGLQETYTRSLAKLGEEILSLDPAAQDDRLREVSDFTYLVYGHVCEGLYGAPEYGGNRGLAGWNYLNYEGDVQPRGFTDAEVSGA